VAGVQRAGRGDGTAEPWLARIGIALKEEGMAKIEDLAKKLGAEVAGTVPDYSAGAFGVAKLAQTLRERLEPGHGKRPGRPSNPAASYSRTRHGKPGAADEGSS
jgi:hypothetical protein